MFRRTPKKDPDFEVARTKLLEELEQHDPNSEEFAIALRHLEKIKELESKDKGKIDPNTWINVGGKFLIALAVIAYEQKHVWTTKALPLFLKSD